jgi:ribosomal-protein-alanine N-acetyltransferase
MAEGDSEFPALETERLVLREFTDADAPWYLSHFSKSEIVEATGQEGPADLDAAKEEMERYILGLQRRGEGYRWGITLKGRPELIGSAGLFKWDKVNRRAEIGYDLDPGFWRRGIMTEALTEVISYGFGRMDLNRITLLAFPHNERSVGIARKLGFTQEGRFRMNSCFRGRFYDDVLFALLRDEWRR